jgi:hypothetical protein
MDDQYSLQRATTKAQTCHRARIIPSQFSLLSAIGLPTNSLIIAWASKSEPEAPVRNTPLLPRNLFASGVVGRCY